MVYIAYKCVGDETYQTKKDSALEYILQHQEQNGLFGNEFSTSLAIQVRSYLSNKNKFGNTWT